MIRNRNNNSEGVDYVLTPQRKLILEVIEDSKVLLNARELYLAVIQKDSSVSLATVYRTLGLLKQRNMVAEHRMGNNGCCYEVSRSLENQHALCLKCGKILDYQSGLVAELVKQLQEQHGFCVEKVELCLKGVCRECRDK